MALNRSLLNYLSDANIDEKEKKSYLLKNYRYLNYFLYQCDVDALISSFFDGKIPISCLSILSNCINEMRFYNNKSKDLTNKKINNLKFEQNIKLKFSSYHFDYSKFLFKNYIPIVFKEEMFDLSKNFNSNNFVDKLNSNDYTFEEKKEIIKYVLDDHYDYFKNSSIYKALIEVENLDLIKYIIDTKITSNKKINDCLKYFRNDIGNYIIEKCIDENNIIDILSSVLFDDHIKNEIYNLKKNLVTKSIKKMENFKLFSSLSKNEYGEIITNNIIDDNYKLIKRKSYFIDPVFFVDQYLDSKNDYITNMIYDSNKRRFKLIIMFSPFFSPIKWLISSNPSKEMKKFIYKCRRLKVEFDLLTLNSFFFPNFFINSNDKYDVPPYLVDKLLKYRKKSVIKYIKSRKIDGFLFDFKFNKINEKFLNLIIDYSIDEKNILDVLANKDIPIEILDKIIKRKNKLLIPILEKVDSKDIFFLKINNVCSISRNLIIDNFKDLFISKLNELDKDYLKEQLLNPKVLKSLKLLIIQTNGYSQEESILIREFIKSTNNVSILDNYNQFSNLLKKCDIDINLLLQYGMGSRKYNNWYNNIINIINNNNEESFVKVKKYLFSNFYKESIKDNNVSTITDFLELLNSYDKNNRLYKDIANKNDSLTEKEISDIRFYLNTNTNIKIKSLNELKYFRTNTYNSLKNRLNRNNLIKEECIDIFNKYIFCNNDSSIQHIGGITALKILQMNNKESTTINELSNEIITYLRIMELVTNTNDIDSLKSILEKVFESEENFIKTQNIFEQLPNKVNKLFELDSQINLTTFDDARKIEGIYNEDYQRMFSGEVFDYRDKNYVLYAHVVSNNEEVEKLLNGESNGTRNFISLSPISYKGQQYYYNGAGIILLYDKVGNGSFICSSTNNMGTNSFINNNSSEICEIDRNQRGILETSAVIMNNSEALFYREGLKAAAIALPGGRKPTKEEIRIHKKYNLPFCITQSIEETIENPKKVFKPNDMFSIKTNQKELDEMLNELLPKVVINKENEIYTGKEIAIFTDSHALYEPTLAVLEDIRKNGISEIYSLGDNIGSGSNPLEVLELLELYNVTSLEGNSECYISIGTEPFNYLTEDRLKNEEWTKKQIGSKISNLSMLPATIDLIVGNKKIGLCHFINDVRFDYLNDHNTWNYQEIHNNGECPKQFLYTNSEEYKKEVEENYQKNGDQFNGFKLAKSNPMFEGKSILDYDAIIQGHVHFELNDKIENTNIYTLRGVAIGYNYRDFNTACYYVIKEKKDGDFDLEKKLIPYNKHFVVSNIESSSLPSKTKILSYLGR